MNSIFARIVEEYDLGKVISFERIAEGVLNDNYKLETEKGWYFVKGVRGKVAHRIPYIQQVESFFKNASLPAIAMCVTEAGTYSVEIEGVSYCLYPYIKSNRDHQYSRAEYKNMGNMLGRIHRVTERNVPDQLKQYEFKKSSDEEMRERFEPWHIATQGRVPKEEIEAVFLAYMNMKVEIRKNWQRPEFLPNDRLIHGDYHAGNLLLDENNRAIIGIIDWEKAEYGSRAYELARSILYIAFNEAQLQTHSFDIARSIIEGYREEQDISAEEIIQGLMMRLHTHIYSAWLEEKFYRDHDMRANHLVENEMAILRIFIHEEGIEKMSKLI